MDLYEELGIRTFINAYRPLTRLGGAIMRSAVVEAMQEASRKSVDLRAMQRRVGEVIASLTHNDAAYISCGAASGITLAVAACMAGTDPILSAQLPDTSRMKGEVLMQKCDRASKSDVAIRCSGATITAIGDHSGATEEQIRDAITDQTAAIFTAPPDRLGHVTVRRMISIARDRGIPVLVDAAFQVPPKETLWIFTRELGADAVIVSGGKGLGGPQSTGLVLGKSWIIQACAFHGAPNDRIGRGMKVGKEELGGIYAAVRLFMQEDQTSILAEKLRQLEYIAECITDLGKVYIKQLTPLKVLIGFETDVYGFNPASASRWLLDLTPAVYVEPSTDGLIVSTECLSQGNERIVGQQLRKLFESRSSHPSAGRTDRRDVETDFPTR